MRSCCAVYVDVGYLLAAAATRVTGSSLRRGVQTDYASLIAWLGGHAQEDSGLPLLRINWYDAGGRPGGMPDPSQDEIGQLPGVKLRLGRLSYSGEQKGVDVRIGLDLAIQAQHRVADVVYLVSGDDDLTEAVEEAQSQGVQVVLLAVPRHDENPLAVSKHLLRAVDRTLVIDQDAVDAAFKPTAIPEALIPSDETADD
ncbi:MAG: NYN domain-containing protein, partial [Mobilicoccus sp.]|nr:NYN domain-containing protein [Mobilicoccus sp.]